MPDGDDAVLDVRAAVPQLVEVALPDVAADSVPRLQQQHYHSRQECRSVAVHRCYDIAFMTFSDLAIWIKYSLDTGAK